MKKSKLSAGLVTGFIAALALCACDNVSKDNDHIVTFKDYGSGDISIMIDPYYNSYRNSPDGVEKIYNAALESIIRYEFQSGKMDGKTEKTLSDLKEDATNKVKGKKEDAKDAAESNHTSYDEEWQSILKSHDCDDENALYQHFLFDLEKEQVEDWYLKQSYQRSSDKTLIQEFIGVDDTGAEVPSNVAAAYPIHIRHILASIGDDATRFYNNVISEEEAKTLWNIVGGLADEDYTFGDVALRYSGDSGSAAEFGDMGIMTPTSPYVAEFKLGVYAYETIFANHPENTTIEDGLLVNNTIEGRTKTIKEEFNDIGLATVPLRAFYQINKFADVTKDDAGQKVNDGNEHYYPRNIYWNLYCNLHQPFVVTDENLKEAGDAGLDASFFDNSRFVDASTFGLDSKIGSHKVLVDNKGRLIIGARGQYGIHFMIVQKSIYDFREGGEETNLTSLEEYYTPYIPGDANYPKYLVDGELVNKENTFIDYYSTNDVTVYTTRANKVKDAITSFDKTYDYRIYTDFIGDSTVHFIFNGEEDLNLGEKIAELIQSKMEDNFVSRDNSLTNEWRSYIELIELQNANRIEMVPAGGGKAVDNNYRLIPEGCAIGYQDAEKTGDEWKEGGYCYAK